MKKVIRLTESDIRRMVIEGVNNFRKESDMDPFERPAHGFAPQEDEFDFNDYSSIKFHVVDSVDGIIYNGQPSGTDSRDGGRMRRRSVGEFLSENGIKCYWYRKRSYEYGTFPLLVVHRRDVSDVLSLGDVVDVLETVEVSNPQEELKPFKSNNPGDGSSDNRNMGINEAVSRTMRKYLR